MSVVASKIGQYGGQAGETGYLSRRARQPVGAGPGIVFLHGRGGNAAGHFPYANKLAVGYWFDLLAREGFRCMAIDQMGGTSWGNQASTDRVNEAITYLQDPAKGGAKAGKVGIFGYSMGGIAALNWLDQNVAKHACSWLFAPATDLEWVHAQTGWTAEVDAAYGGNYAANKAGQDPTQSPANYRGLGPIHCAHSVDDATIPVQKTRDFVAAVADPQVTLTEYAQGGHNAVFTNVSDAELVGFYRTHLGVPA